MQPSITVLFDESMEKTKRLVNEFCKVGTHVFIADSTGRVLEYTVITRDSKDSFRTKPHGGPVCPVELMYRNTISVNTNLVTGPLPETTTKDYIINGLCFFATVCFMFLLLY